MNIVDSQTHSNHFNLDYLILDWKSPFKTHPINLSSAIIKRRREIQVTKLQFRLILHFLPRYFRWRLFSHTFLIYIFLFPQPAVNESIKQLKNFNRSLKKAQSFRAAREKIDKVIKSLIMFLNPTLYGLRDYMYSTR